ncbi:MAG: hypothetical protein M5U33_00520 [Pseudorhodoplanes sp.]|nr:hypothetical protein [Pseudorhodoplanes sp.]
MLRHLRHACGDDRKSFFFENPRGALCTYGTGREFGFCTPPVEARKPAMGFPCRPAALLRLVPMIAAPGYLNVPGAICHTSAISSAICRLAVREFALPQGLVMVTVEDRSGHEAGD